MRSQEALTIAVAVSDEQIQATRDVMLQLRPLVPPDEYLPTLRRMMQVDDYHLVALYTWIRASNERTRIDFTFGSK